MTAPLVYIDGFDHQDISRYSVAGTSPTFVAGRFGGYALRTAGTGDANPCRASIDLPAATGELSFGLSYNPVTLGGNNAIEMLRVVDSAGTMLMSVESSGASSGNTPRVMLFHNSSGTPYNYNFSTAWPGTNTWCSLEVRFKYNISGGAVEVRLNGSTVHTYSGSTNNTGGISNPTRITFGQNTYVSGTYNYDDLWVESGSGAGFRGERKVVMLKPTSDTAAGWNATTGANHFSQVADASTSTYITDVGGSGHVDTFGFEDLAGDVAAVEGVTLTALARKGDIGTVNLALARGGTSGTSKPVTIITGGGWQNVSETFQTAGDATAWTPSKVNSSTFGLVSAV